MGPTEAYQDPAISSRGSRTSEGTDQRFVGIDHDMTTLDKAVVLYTGSRKCFESVRGKSEPTLGDLAEKDLKTYPYDFWSRFLCRKSILKRN